MAHWKILRAFIGTPGNETWQEPPPGVWPEFNSDAEAIAGVAAVSAVYNTMASHTLNTCTIVGAASYYDSGEGIERVRYQPFTVYIKRIQRYKVTCQNSPQPLCSLKETAYTKISGFRKWSL